MNNIPNRHVMTKEPNTKTIFVQIASYRDDQLLPTIDDLIQKAENPQNLHVCVCWQYTEEEENKAQFDSWGLVVTKEYTYHHDNLPYEVFEGTKGSTKITIIPVDCTTSLGACWARNFIQQFYAGETYTLQLDSHHRFIDGWDSECIEILEGLRESSPKPVLTSYLPSFDPTRFPEGCDKGPYQINFQKFADSGVLFPIPSIIVDWEKKDAPIKARFYSAHFTFADGTFAEEIQHDPELFFLGEEISIAVRAFTHGYDLYHPHKILAWHEYIRKEKPKVWDSKGTATNTHWANREAISNKRYHALFGGKVPSNDPYGFGNVRTLREYEIYAGVNFEKKVVQQYTLDQKEPPNPPVENWDESFAIKRVVYGEFTKEELGAIPEDITFAYFAVKDAEGNDMYRKDLTKDQFLSFMKHNKKISISETFFHEKVPITMCIWPHSESQGWMKLVEKKVNTRAEKKLRTVSFSLNKDELGRLTDDLEFCFLGIESEKGNLLHRADIRGEPLKHLMDGKSITINKTFESEEEPHFCATWPYSAESGWLELQKKEINQANISNNIKKFESKTPTVFVQIASYRDPQLLPTIRSAINNASDPSKLHFGICWQRDDSETLEEFTNHRNVRYLSYHYSNSKGLGWARSKLLNLYEGEDMILQLDSHHRFAPGWDQMLMEDYNSALQKSKKPIITTYLTPFLALKHDRGEEGLNSVPSIMCPFKFDQGLLISRVSYLKNHETLNAPVPHIGISAHFFFTHSDFLHDVPYDPDIYFGGETEETTLAVRAWTRGYDFFAPHRAYAWHDYSRQGRNAMHWDDDSSRDRNDSSWEKRQFAKKKTHQIFRQSDYGIQIKDIHDLGNVRTLQEYETYAGVNFKENTVSKYTSEGNTMPNPEYIEKVA